MKKIITGLVLVFTVSFLSPVWAQQKSGGGYGTGAYSELDAGRSYFQRMSDWMATAGKSREEKALIKSRRRTERKLREARKNIIRKKKEIIKKKRQLLKK